MPGILWATGQSGLLKMPTWLGDLKTSFDMKSHRSSSAPKVMVSRVTLLLYIFAAKDTYWIYEQPGSSLLWYHPRMTEYIRHTDCYRAWTWMGAYGKASPKPKGTTLWSNDPIVRKLSRTLPERRWVNDMIRKTTRSDGTCSVSGGKDLKGSQAYTSEFGFSVLTTWLERGGPSARSEHSEVPLIWGHLSKKERWEDANLDPVFQYLTFK